MVNYDAAKDVDTHVHRIGRTGRAGDKDGTAYTLVAPNQNRVAGAMPLCCRTPFNVLAGTHLDPGPLGLAEHMPGLRSF